MDHSLAAALRSAFENQYSAFENIKTIAGVTYESLKDLSEKCPRVRRCDHGHVFSFSALVCRELQINSESKIISFDVVLHDVHRNGNPSYITLTFSDTTGTADGLQVRMVNRPNLRHQSEVMLNGRAISAEAVYGTVAEWVMQHVGPTYGRSMIDGVNARTLACIPAA